MAADARRSPRSLPRRRAEAGSEAHRVHAADSQLTARHGHHVGRVVPLWIPRRAAGRSAARRWPLALLRAGAPRPEPLDLLGAPALTARLAIARPAGLVIARLCDVAPDGSSRLM